MYKSTAFRNRTRAVHSFGWVKSSCKEVDRIQRNSLFWSTSEIALWLHLSISSNCKTSVPAWLTHTSQAHISAISKQLSFQMAWTENSEHKGSLSPNRSPWRVFRVLRGAFQWHCSLHWTVKCQFWNHSRRAKGKEQEKRVTHEACSHWSGAALN